MIFGISALAWLIAAAGVACLLVVLRIVFRLVDEPELIGKPDPRCEREAFREYVR